MSILVTGASGFIGSALVRYLNSKGVVAIGNCRTYLKEEPDWLFGNFGEIEPSTLIERQIEAVIHCAWFAEPGLYWESEENEICAEASLRFLETCAGAGIGRFLGTGSCAEIGANPDSAYARFKKEFRVSGQEMARKYGVNFDWAYLFYPYGPGEDRRRLVSSIVASLGKGESFKILNPNASKDYIYIEDVVSALFQIVSHDRSHKKGVCDEFEVGVGITVNVVELAWKIADVMDRKRDLIIREDMGGSDDSLDLCADNRALKDIGWRKKTCLVDGLKAVVRGL